MTQQDFEQKGALKIGLAIPCHVKDLSFLKVCLNSIKHLSPQPYKVEVNVNEGQQSLKDIRSELFDLLFEEGCDVVLSCDSDFWLFPTILQHVKRDIPVSFAELKRSFSDLPMTIIRLFWRGSWSGCYSLPRNVWQYQIKGFWDGTDGSVKKLLKGNYSFIRKFQYYDLRPFRRESVDFVLANKSLGKRLFWRLTRLH